MNEQIKALNEDQECYIAVIGMSGRFPGADTLDEFWNNIELGKHSIADISDNQLLHSGVPKELLQNSNFVKRASLIKDCDYFDASFFGVSPREAESMDPQHRIFLECCYEALESSGYPPGKNTLNVGVYAGCALNYYLIKNILSKETSVEDTIDLMTFINNDKDFLTTRVSYKLNLDGPSMTVQTACSTSLVAVHTGSTALLNYQCDMVLCGGIAVASPKIPGYLYRDGEIFSRDGYCRAFDAEASGTIFGEGCGVVLLKRLNEALQDNDTIHAVIRGSAINNDASEKVGYSAPSVNGQAKVIAQAQAISNVTPEQITYIETHGTGTQLGDPIEVSALSKVFNNETRRYGPCYLGSVKSNIGHCDTAAGIAGLIKTVYALKKKMIPPQIFFNQPNPEINFKDSPFVVSKEAQEWNTTAIPRLAGVSSFGVGGTNVHVILEEPPEIGPVKNDDPNNLFLISAHSSKARDWAAKRLKDHVIENADLGLQDTAYTLQVGRQHFKDRFFTVCKTRSELIDSLEHKTGLLCGRKTSSFTSPQVVFMFSGQGAQYPGMARGLYRQEKLVRDILDRARAIMMTETNLDLFTVLFPDPGVSSETAANELKATRFTQPALFAIEYAIANLWINYGIKPTACIGHSIGEYTAAVIAGIMSFEECMKVIIHRGQIMGTMLPGAMTAVPCAEAKIIPRLTAKCELALVNAPEMCVVAGPEGAIREFEQIMAADDIVCRHLKTSHAFHTSMMDVAAQNLLPLFKKVPMQQPSIPFISNMSGSWISPEEATTPEYWATHLRQTVRFSAGIETLLKNDYRIFIEIGPGNALSSLVLMQKTNDPQPVSIQSLRHVKQSEDDDAFFKKAIGNLWLNGVSIDWSVLHAGSSPYRVPLPTYPFERQRYWVDRNTKTGKKIKKTARYNNLKNINTKFTKQIPQKKVFSRENSEQTLLKIWKKVLGKKEISVKDDFFSIGGHSLLAAELFAEIESVFGKTVPLATLYKSSSIEKLAEELTANEDKKSWSSLVTIKQGGEHPPLFLVHGAEGNVLLYRSLAKHLNDDQPVYGLQSAGLDGKSEFNPEFEIVAAKYIREIKKVQEKGPYLLGGYCLGGTIALEIAQQLQKQGNQVTLVAMIENYNVKSLSKWPLPLSLRLYNSMMNIVYHGLNLLASKNKMAFFLEKIKVEISRFKIGLKIALLKLLKIFGIKYSVRYHHLKIDDLYDQALERYVPQPYPGKLTLFVPRVLQAGLKDFQTNGFGAIAQDGVKRYEIPVYPRGTLVEPYVKHLAEKLEQCIQEVNSK